MPNEAAVAPAHGAKGADGAALLQNRYVIHPHKPAPELSTPSAQAFLAEDRRDPARNIFALIARPDLPPRTNVMRSLKGVQAIGLMQMVEWGVIHWPPAGRELTVVVYEKPLGGPVMASLSNGQKRLDEWEISKKLVEPLATALKELTTRGMTHRAIRPTNLFWMEGEGEGMALGDCVTAPPGFDQPLVFETIESAMTAPHARGSGRYTDDLYSLGVTLVTLLMGRNPVAHLADEKILRGKIAVGSYAVLVGDERLPLSMTEVLRGLLCDDEDERWSIETLDLWLSGRRLSPLQPKLEKRAQRTFTFRGSEYGSARELGRAMANHWDDAIPVVLEGKLELWLRRALEDKDRAEGVSAAVRNVTGALIDKKIAADLMLAKVCMVLDPAAPIRYKGFHAMPDGFGSALALIMGEGRDNRLWVEAVQRGVPKLWFESRDKYSPDHSILDTNFNDLRDYIKAPIMGMGLERCLYELNETLPCQSPLLATRCVVDIQGLLPALDEAAKTADTQVWPFDRHIAAFIATNLKYNISQPLQALNDDAPDLQVLGMLNLLAVLQWRLGPERLPALTSWVGGLLGPVIASYHSRERRQVLEKNIPRLVRQGSLLELYRFVDDPEERRKDADGFAWGQADWAAAEQEARELEAGKDEREIAAVRTGQQAAALTSVIIALLTLTILTIMQVW